MIRLFGWYATRYLRKHFDAVRLLGDPPANLPDAADPRALLIYLNHPSWWDPMAITLLIRRYFRRRPGYGPIDAEALERYRFMGKLGFFGIDPETRAGAERFLRVGRAVLETPGETLWVTAQGFFTDVRERPIALRPGVAHLVRKVGGDAGGTFGEVDGGSSGGVVAVPLAVEVVFWFERRPELLLAFGEPLAVGGTGRSVEGWNDTLGGALEATMDRVAAASMRRDAAEWTTLVEGKRGVGGVYDGWRRLRAWAGGRRFNPRHMQGDGRDVRGEAA